MPGPPRRLPPRPEYPRILCKKCGGAYVPENPHQHQPGWFERQWHDHRLRWVLLGVHLIGWGGALWTIFAIHAVELNEALFVFFIGLLLETGALLIYTNAAAFLPDKDVPEAKDPED